MNYNEFKIYRKDILEANKDNANFLDLSDNNLYGYFNNISDKINMATKTNDKKEVYRCHLLEKYLELFNLPQELKHNTGVSLGVRDSLKILFKELDSWIIPQDVYPFYSDTLKEFKKEYDTYQTLNNFSLDDYSTYLFNTIPNGTLLINYPLKPYGRTLLRKEILNLRSFLKQDKNNTIVIDLVYWTDFNYPNDILELYKTGKVIILHSLSKMFIMPNMFGVCILPDKFKPLQEKFKNLPKDKHDNLLKVDTLLNTKLHKQIVKHKNANIILNNIEIFNSGILEYSYITFTAGYLFYAPNTSHKNFLDRNILTIPESVFGGSGSGSVLSTLLSKNNLTE